MNQMKWTFVDDSLGQHRVGIMHGPRTGHLVVYCNRRIVLIDFEIKQSKSYSFFINEQLCRIHIVQDAADQYSYGFEVDTEADTPHNNERKATSRRHLRYTIFLALAIAGLLFLGVRFFAVNDDLFKKRKALSDDPILVHAVVQEVPVPQRNNSLRYRVALSQGFLDESLHPSDIDKDQRLLLYLPFVPGDTIVLRAYAYGLNVHEVYVDKEGHNYALIYPRMLSYIDDEYPVMAPVYKCALARMGSEKGLVGLAELLAFLSDSPDASDRWGRRPLTECSGAD